MQLFKRKTMVEKIETELAALTQRRETLAARHKAAEAAHTDAKSKLQRHHLEADVLDADDKTRAKLEAAVASWAVTLAGYADALTEVKAKIGDTEAKLMAERAAVERKAASEKLAHDLDEVEQALPVYLEAGRRFADAIEAVGFWHFESGEMSAFVRNISSQVEVASAFSLHELRSMVGAIRDGAAPIPPRQPAPQPIAEIIQPAPTRTLFCLKSVKWSGGSALQYEDVELPIHLADRAVRCGACVSVTDDRRKTLLGARGGHHVNLNALDVVDLDALDDASGVRFVGPVRALPPGFVEIDRSSEARVISIPAQRAG
jgi:hypothetical protein